MRPCLAFRRTICTIEINSTTDRQVITFEPRRNTTSATKTKQSQKDVFPTLTACFP